ncbi:MAG: cyclase family protein [Candidatus Sericytochromatia bacterium]
MKYIDISPTITSDIAVFPGDKTFERNILLDFKQGHNLLLSSINSTVHLGAHTDAPNHYHPDGEDIAQRSLNYYIGKCQIISVNIQKKDRIYPKDIKNIEIKAERVLFKTNSFPNPNLWNDDFNSLSPELIKYLKDKNVILVGIDTPSVDPSDSKDLETHNSIYNNDLAILEGIVLSEVQDGIYTLIALPLKIQGADASPVRAILVELT